MRPTIATIDLDAVENNVKAIDRVIRQDCKVMAVVKANAYGHGDVEVARVALEAGATYLAVAIYDEALHLRRNGITAPILILGGMLPSDCADCVEDDITPTVYTVEQVLAMQERAEKLGRSARLHIKINSGFNRIGVRCRDLNALLDCIKSCDRIRLEGMFTHFSTADMEDDSFVDTQYQEFVKAEQIVKDAGFCNVMTHLSNSGAIIRRREMDRDMVRAGLILYGPNPSDDLNADIGLQPCMKLSTRITCINEIVAGETVGYGRTYRADHPIKVATLPIGYADGYRRVRSLDMCVLVGGKRCKLVGRVCMDQTMCDVSDIPDVQVGDEVVLFGKQGEEEILVEDVARWCNTIPNEILTGISERVPRVFIKK